jgi:hypothetical protein
MDNLEFLSDFLEFLSDSRGLLLNNKSEFFSFFGINSRGELVK